MKLARLNAIAETAVADARRRLPTDVRRAAEAVPVCYESRPTAARLDDGVDDDLLGLFVGHVHGGELAESQPLPPQILLFVDNLWDEAGHDVDAYREEVRITYLHELGHYLGWDEDEVARRGLD